MYKENLGILGTDWNSQPLAGWDDSHLDVLGEKDFNIKPQSFIKKSENRINHSSKSKRHAKTQVSLDSFSSVYETLKNFQKKINQQSHIDILKKEANHLDDDSKTKVKFPNHSLQAEKMNLSKIMNLNPQPYNNKRKSILMVTQLGNYVKRIKTNLNLTANSSKNSQNDKIQLSIEGRNQNFTKVGFYSSSNKKTIERPQTSKMSPASNLLNENTPVTIHCKKDLKTPFKRFFQNKRNRNQQSRGRNSLSINQIEGTKLRKLLSVVEKR